MSDNKQEMEGEETFLDVFALELPEGTLAADIFEGVGEYSPTSGTSPSYSSSSPGIIGRLHSDFVFPEAPAAGTYAPFNVAADQVSNTSPQDALTAFGFPGYGQMFPTTQATAAGISAFQNSAMAAGGGSTSAAAQFLPPLPSDSLKPQQNVFSTGSRPNSEMFLMTSIPMQQNDPGSSWEMSAMMQQQMPRTINGKVCMSGCLTLYRYTSCAKNATCYHSSRVLSEQQPETARSDQ